MKQVRVAILGQGRSGRDIHAEFLITDPERFKIVAVVDPLPDRRKKAEDAYGCASYEHHGSLFERRDIDLVVNATPSHLHVPISLEFLDRGVHVLSEKPLARKVEDVDTLLEASKRSGKVLAVFQQSRFAPYFTKVREIIDSGVLGRIVQISIAFNGFARRWDWQTLQAFGGGNLLNTGPHPMDQALQLFGTDKMPNVFCRMDRVNTFGDAEDYVKIILSGEGRPLIDMEISSCCAYPSFTYNVQGSHGGLKGNMTHIDWKWYRPEEAPEQRLVKTPLMKTNGDPAYPVEQLTWHENSWDVPEEQKNLFHAISGMYYDMLYKTLTFGTPLEVTPEQVRQQIAVMEECHRQNPLSQEFFL